METGNQRVLVRFSRCGQWTHHPLWIFAWAGEGGLTDKSSDNFNFIFFIFYRGDLVASLEGLDGDP